MAVETDESDPMFAEVEVYPDDEGQLAHHAACAAAASAPMSYCDTTS